MFTTDPDGSVHEDDAFVYQEQIQAPFGNVLADKPANQVDVSNFNNPIAYNHHHKLVSMDDEFPPIESSDIAMQNLGSHG